jgi:hypothetical protein
MSSISPYITVSTSTLSLVVLGVCQYVSVC